MNNEHFEHYTRQQVLACCRWTRLNRICHVLDYAVLLGPRAFALTLEFTCYDEGEKNARGGGRSATKCAELRGPTNARKNNNAKEISRKWKTCGFC